MRNKNIIVLSIAIIVISFLAFKLYKSGFNYAWVNSAKIYNEFKLKKQLEQKLNAVQASRTAIIDSLELELKFLYQSLNTKNEESVNTFNAKKEFFLTKKQQFSEDNVALEEQYNEQILNQLNQYLSDYAKEKKIEILFGADGKGTIIYASEGKEVTEELIIYANKKFEGEK